jgi:mannose-1-phosphate guanylyltransferase
MIQKTKSLANLRQRRQAHARSASQQRKSHMLNFNYEQRQSSALWGLVLAAGDGKRLQNYIRHTHALDLPKQYVSFVGQRSMLEHTYDRAEQLIPPKRILTVVGQHHLRHSEVRRQLAQRPSENIIVQPDNKETGPGIFLPLMHLFKRSPQAIVALFPSDHFILEEARFMDHVALAARAVSHKPSTIALLAMEADAPEVEYGYIVPRSEPDQITLWGTRGAAKFVEKPNTALAQEIVKAGGLWNTMIMVFKARTLLEMLATLNPPVARLFARVFDAIGTPAELETVEAVYQLLEPMNFSKDFLEKVADAYPDAISVLPVLQVFWSDLGAPRRIAQVLELLEHRRDRQPETTAAHRHGANSRAPTLSWRRALA